MATLEETNLKMYGPAATHEMPCAIYGCKKKAVIDINEGIFQPCWTHQSLGYAVRRHWKARLSDWWDRRMMKWNVE